MADEHLVALEARATSHVEVLIVDDNRDLAENIAEILEGIDEPPIRCHIATDGKTALEMAGAMAIDVALLDLHLPDARGTELSGALRRCSPFVEVVIVTGDTAVESAIHAVKTGAFAYVLKPFRGAEFVETVRRAVAQSRLCREREQLRRELEYSERRHREVVEAVPAFVIALDGDGRIVLWNRRLENVAGYDRREMLGVPGQHLVGQSGEDRRLPIKGGGHKMVRWQRAPVSAERDALTYAVGIDVTGELEMRRRTLRAERLAAVGTLAAGLAHEVRNPLNSALLQLNVLERRIGKAAPADSLLSVVTVVKDEIRRLDRLVSDFLAFAQPRPLDLKETAVNELLKGVATLVAVEAEQAGIELQLDLEAEAGNLHVEAERLRQVLLNLLRNALEAMGSSGTLTIRSRGPDEAGNVQIEVADTGPGFAEDAPIFDAFYTTKPQGTGLGLAIAHRIIAEHGGQITVTSRPGATCFAVTLPQLP